VRIHLTEIRVDWRPFAVPGDQDDEPGSPKCESRIQCIGRCQSLGGFELWTLEIATSLEDLPGHRGHRDHSATTTVAIHVHGSFSSATSADSAVKNFLVPATRQVPRNRTAELAEDAESRMSDRRGFREPVQSGIPYPGLLLFSVSS